MNMPIDEALEIVRRQSDPRSAWLEALSLCRTAEPSDLWDALPMPDVAGDIAAATEWLSAQLAAMPEASGIYLGLDTLNMDDGEGANVEIGGTTACDVSHDELDWVYGDLLRGESHLILGLHALHAVYSQPQWEEMYDVSDYILFLAYSGIVLGQAFVRLPFQRALLPVWGFHDGDLFILGRKTSAGFELVCR